MKSSAEKIWFVGPSLKNLLTLHQYFKKEGIKILSFEEGEQVSTYAFGDVPDVIIIDVDLPGIDGIETCRQLKRIDALEDTLIVFLTDKKANYIQIAAFDAGADDYLIKPIDSRVLHSKIEAHLKRINKHKGQILENHTQSPIVIDQDGMTVIKNGKRIEWQNKEFELLNRFHSSPGKVFTRTELIKTLWPNKKVSNPRIIDVYIRRIREKIGRNHILTVIGKGYKFVE